MKILIIDLETSPNLAHVWGMWKQNIAEVQLLEASRTLCWAAKWYGSDEVLFSSEMKTDHKTMIVRAWELLDEADAVIHYNGKKFDIPTLNKEFLLYGLTPPSPYKQIDLLQIVKSSFRFPRNGLNYVAKRLGIGAKAETMGHELWIRCLNGDREAWDIMEVYNKQDVNLTEEVYKRLLPWIKTHPNAGLYSKSDRPVCTNCGSERVHKKGPAYTAVGIYQRYRCISCGTNLRGRYNIGDKEARKNILTQDKS